jgi:hypothetical protein
MERTGDLTLGYTIYRGLINKYLLLFGGGSSDLHLDAISCPISSVPVVLRTSVWQLAVNIFIKGIFLFFVFIYL